MRQLKTWTIAEATPAGLRLTFPGGHLVDLMVLGPRLIRVLARKGGACRLDRTWTIDPDGRTPLEGRDRLSVEGFAGAPFAVDAPAATLATDDLRVTVRAPLSLAWEARTADGWRVFAEDRPAAAWALGGRDHACAHHMRLREGDRIWGVGEKAGALERTGRRFEMRTCDAMGYDAEAGDPLYKHIPFTLTRTGDAGWFSLFYDNLAPGWLDCGLEIDNYHPRFRTFRAQDGDLDLYVRWAERPMELVTAQTAMTGGAAFFPRWSLGYSGSTMQYTDADDAQARLEGFLDKCAAHSVPCDSFHLSSGYTAIGDRRYVFNWNHDRVPDPEGLAARFTAAGVKFIPNIKPVLLDDHPLYATAEEAGVFVRSDGATERAPFWDGEGSHLDFTNPAAQAWWREHLTAQLLDKGYVATWNDNNEFQIADRDARLDGFGRPLPADPMRPVLTHLMVRASEDAQRAHAPERRPFLVTRSGCAGLQARAQTWSGDNRTEWKTIRFNQWMGLSMALCGISNVGHDVGGFAGPKPGAELFLRWVQNGALHPRFSIHSWNADGSVTEPWSFPEVLGGVRAAMALRCRLMPYLYTLLWRSHAEHAPMIRPTFLDHPDDAEAFDECDEYLLGPDLLVATVMAPGATTRALRLPAHAGGWWSLDGAAVWDGAERIEVPAPLDAVPVFARGGSVVPMSDRVGQAAGGPEEARTLAVFPHRGAGRAESLIYDDDGETVRWRDAHLLLRAEVASRADRVDVTLTRSGDWRPGYAVLRPQAPVAELRPLFVNGVPAAPLAIADLSATPR